MGKINGLIKIVDFFKINYLIEFWNME